MKALFILSLSAATAFGAATYPIVDTGQTTAYGNHKGQDAHYSANAPSYKDNGDGTVTDQVTGLMWIKDPGEKMTFSDAVKNASACKTGGYKDWRLPTIKELYSLIKLDGLDPDPFSEETGNLKPFIDDSVFKFSYGDPSKGERIIDSQFASSTKYVSTTMNGNETMFGVNFADGRIKGYPIKSRRTDKTFHVLYVRGNTDYGINSFKDNGNGTITDEATGLTWMQADSGTGMDWPAALEYAESMEFAGHSDWRLPTAKELQSIIDYTRSPDTTGSAAIDPVFETTEIENEGGKKDFGHYWSSTSHISTRSNASATYFAFGRSLGWMGPDENKTLLDVHGAGSQRSDPKTGDASRFPFGRGPQGDVIRIDNMVRLVRGGNVKEVNPSIEQESVRGQRGPESQQQTSQPEHSGGNSNRLMQRFDRNGDNKITEEEFQGPIERFILLDLNTDGVITAEEAAAASPPRRGHETGGTPRPFDHAAAPMPTVPPPETLSEGNLPNIIFIYADDMGWTGTSVEMVKGDASTRSDFHQTPNLEKLAADGMVFSRAYSPGSLCTPSRAAVLTGKTPAELHITTPGNGQTDGTRKMITPRPSTNLPDDLPTIGTMLKKRGYSTALLGKWHIGRRDDAGLYGFDLHDGPSENNTNGTDEDPKEIFSLTERGVEFMKQSVKAGTPFYLQISHYAVHTPVQTRPESLEKFEKMPSGGIHIETDFAGMTWDLDNSLQQIFEAAEQLKIKNSTYIVFMSDNGAHGNRRKPNNTPLYSGKGTLYEGGIRVPLIISGPGIKTGYCSEPVSGTDLFPTISAWSGSTETSGEGEDLTPLLTGNKRNFERRNALLFHYPHYGQGPQVPQTALISGNWKLLRDWDAETTELFNLKNDISENEDLSSEEPDIFNKMTALLDQRLKETGAQLVTENPDYKTETTPRRRRK